MATPVGCRISSYGPHLHLAIEHIASLGLHHVEMPLPPAAQVSRYARRLRDLQLSISALQVFCDLSRPAVADDIARQLPLFAELDCPRLLLVLRGPPGPTARAIDRLRRIGDLAAAAGVSVLLETHPPLATNGRVACKTLRRVRHPAVRLNYDPANVVYYNRGSAADPLRALRQVLPLVAGVHLKDAVAPQVREFPPLGDGTVNFPALFQTLDAAGFVGPYTIELESPSGQALSEQAVRERVERSVRYLRALGRLG